MAFCDNCGEKLEDGAAFCGNCGAKLQGGTAAPVTADSDPAARYRAAGNTHAVNGRFAEAAAAFTQAIEADANNAEYFYLRGRVWYELKDWDKAIDDFTRVSGLNASASITKDACLVRALCHEEKGDWQSAYQDYRTADELVPPSPFKKRLARTIKELEKKLK
jgi:tetratricopeptide (TPR) repeat protein